MQLTHQQLAASLDAIAEALGKADGEHQQHIFSDDEWAAGNAKWYLHLAYTQLITLCENLGLPLLREEVATTLRDALADGLLSTMEMPSGDPYLKWSGPCRRFRIALHTVFLTESSQTVTKDLETILRGCTYSITDARAFGSAPADEEAVHLRIEAILRCVFPDLLHKPALTKPIKNFQPDTGIPSIGTLIEYKFVRNATQIPVIADEILADTRGYNSKDWKYFLYVIYETERFRTEFQWRQLLRECGVAENASAIVLTGNPARHPSPHKKHKGAAGSPPSRRGAR
jgi:hypothetical protein